VLVKIVPKEKLEYGDVLLLDGVLTGSNIGGSEVLVLNKPTITKIPKPLWFSLLHKFRVGSKNLYTQVLPTDQASLLLGIVYGIKSPMSNRFSSAIQTVGLTHVSAASGMNVTLLCGFLGTTLMVFMKRQKTVGMIVGILVIYMVLSGLQGSILRATLMGGGAILAGIFGRQKQGVYLLFLTACVLLFISPLLLSDLGFQLSFLSTLGILLFSPFVTDLTGDKILLEDLATSWCAQLLSLPLILITFGKYNLLSLLVNMLVLWVVAPLMILGGLASILGAIVPVIGYLLLVISIPLLWYFQTVTLYFSRFQTSLTISSFPVSFMIFYYCFVGVGYLCLKRYQDKRNDKQ
jgi:competence protein ComEC